MECRVKKSEIVQNLLRDKMQNKREQGVGFAPTNIALCKYWGKRNTELNLPITSSLSISLPDKGALTNLTIIDSDNDIVILNGETLAADSQFVVRLQQYLDLFRVDLAWRLKVDIKMNIPTAAGLASSACGFAALACALNDLFQWQLSLRDLSILARLGSGSASRSLWNGFVIWHEGMRDDGMDSFGEPIACEWPNLRVGILPISNQPKAISSRDAMLRTVNSSSSYSCWTRKVTQDMAIFKQALKNKNFSLLAGTAESNAMAMHATMLSSWPPICYYLPETIAAMHEVWALRQQGHEIYFTQDAGPNLKLLFLDDQAATVKATFPDCEVIKVFE